MVRTAVVEVEAVLAKNLPHRSRDNEFTDGRVYEYKGQKCPLCMRRVKRVLTNGFVTE